MSKFSDWLSRNRAAVGFVAAMFVVATSFTVFNHRSDERRQQEVRFFQNRLCEVANENRSLINENTEDLRIKLAADIEALEVEVKTYEVVIKSMANERDDTGFRQLLQQLVNLDKQNINSTRAALIRLRPLPYLNCKTLQPRG